MEDKTRLKLTRIAMHICELITCAFSLGLVFYCWWFGHEIGAMILGVMCFSAFVYYYQMQLRPPRNDPPWPEFDKKSGSLVVQAVEDD
jgi:hypothetical protein